MDHAITVLTDGAERYATLRWASVRAAKQAAEAMNRTAYAATGGAFWWVVETIVNSPSDTA